MTVIADLRETHLIRHPERLPDRVSRLHAAKATPRAEPKIRGVLDCEHRPRCNETGQHVVIEGQEVGLVGESGKLLREPNIFSDDFHERLYDFSAGVHRVGEPPAGVAAGTGFLGDCQGDAGVEGAGDESAFAVPGAACHCDLVEVEVGCCGVVFETVEDAADTPCPGHHGTCCGVASVEVVEEALPAAGGVVLDAELVVGECDDGYAWRIWDAESIVRL